jgi:hypothetical protein
MRSRAKKYFRCQVKGSPAALGRLPPLELLILDESEGAPVCEFPDGVIRAPTDRASHAGTARRVTVSALPAF